MAIHGSKTGAAVGFQPSSKVKELCMKHGGQLKTGHGGAVPGTGKGDKIPAKYEPGEFVVSNAMLDASPGLREHLDGLRTKVLAGKGVTPAQADAKAMGGKELHAASGYLDEESRKAAIAQIPTGRSSSGPTAPVSGNSIDSTEFSRNVNNSLNALGGMGVVSSVPLGTIGKMARGTELATTAQPVAASVPAFRTLPAANSALQEGAQANALAGATRSLGNASAGLTAADSGQSMPSASVQRPGNINGTNGTWGAAPPDAQGVSDRATATGFIGGLKDANQRAGAAIADVATFIPRGLAGAYDTAVVRPMRAAGVNAGYMSPLLAPAGSDPASQTPFYDKIRQQDAATAAAAPAQAQAGTSTAGAGRGTVNPTIASLSTMPPAAPPAPVPANPNQITATRQPNGTMAFSGGPNIGKDGGDLSYTGPAGFKPSGAGVTVVPGASFANGSPTGDAALAAARMAAADRGDFGAVRDSYFAQGQGFAGQTRDSVAADRLKEIALSPAGTPGRKAAIQMLSDQTSATTARQGQEATNSISRGRLEMEQTAAGFTSRAAKRIEDLHASYAKADAKDKPAIAEQIRVLSGKEPAAHFKTNVLQATKNADGSSTEGDIVTTNEQTGETRRLDGAPKPIEQLPNHIAALKKDPKLAAMFDQQYGAGAAAKILGAK